jgi:hypothetical protein
MFDAGSGGNQRMIEAAIRLTASFLQYQRLDPGMGPSSNSKPKGGSMARDETERYRQAAEDALQQLDWCIGYLHGIHKTKISTQLGKNRTHIKRDLMREPTGPTPSEVTDET